MRITQEIRDYARAGMEEKSKAFLEHCAEIYTDEHGHARAPSLGRGNPRLDYCVSSVELV
jgi:hypothetical protein